MGQINDIKLDLIKLVTKMSDMDHLRSIYQTVVSMQEKSPESNETEDPFLKGQVQVRMGVTKDQGFEEQGNKSINFQELQEIVADSEPWEVSLEEMLDQLD